MNQSSAVAINDHGHPALWIERLGMDSMQFDGWKLQTATWINDKGAICGTGLHRGKRRAFVLVPFARFPGQR